MEGNYLKIVFVIDESGSMSGTESDVIGGFNAFIEQQKEEQDGKITVSVYKFNQVVASVIINEELSNIQPMTKHTYRPSGSTALLDAIGKGVFETDNQIAENAKEKPDKVLMIIVTDGMENASRRFSKTDIRNLILTHEQHMNWEFIYMGADLDNFSDAENLGFHNRTEIDKNDMRTVFNSISEESLNYRKQKNSTDSNSMLKNIIEKSKKK